MPTVSWIQESAEEKLSEYISGLPREKILARCIYCSRYFEEPSELIAHIGIDHPIEIPSLLLLGRPLPSLVIIRRLPNAADFMLLNCSRCRVHFDGQELELEPTDLPSWLARARPLHANVLLENLRQEPLTRVSAELRIEFRIPSEPELDRCDETFIQVLVRPSIQMSDVETYVKLAPQHGISREYSGALADYAVGVLLKEQTSGTGTLGNLREHRDKFMGAIDVLRDFRRPVSDAVTAAIALNLNAWGFLQPSWSLPAFARAAEFFADPDQFAKAGVSKWTVSENLRPICPVDFVTDALLRAIEAIPEAEAGGVMPKAIAELDGLGSVTTEFDLVKRSVVLAVASIRLLDHRATQRYLADIRYDHQFGEWAEAKLLGAKGK